MRKPIVSIVMVTYAHENFILEAIEGVLMQQCNFELELIIANDASPDNTDNFVQSIIENHPRGSWIRYIKHENNIGMMPNFIFALQQCKGKYIALCEGDDYWTDPLKLQKQVEFLEANETFSGCGTNSNVIYHNDKIKKSHLFKQNSNKTILNVDDFLKSRPFHTASFVFRKIEFSANEFLNVFSGDRFLYIMVAISGNIKYLNDVTCVYRKNNQGISSKVTSRDLRNDFNISKMIIKSRKKVNTNILDEFICFTIFDYSQKIYLEEFILYAPKYIVLKFMNNKGTLKSKVKGIWRDLIFINSKRNKLVFLS